MAITQIFFERLRVEASIGILAHELVKKQPIYVDAQIKVNLKQSINDEAIDSVLDYRQIRELIIEICTQGHVNLVETLAQNIGEQLVVQLDEISSARIQIRKPQAFGDCEAVGVEYLAQRQPNTMDQESAHG